MVSKVWASRPSPAVRAHRGTRTQGKQHPPAAPYDDFSRAVNRMTNHQRNRWARARYPGLREREVERLWAFVAPERVAYG